MTQLNHSEADRSTGSRRDRTSDKKTSKWTSKRPFFDIMSEVQKDSQKVSAGQGQFKKSNIKESCPEFDIKVGKVKFDLAQ
jgi:hypothetical protein